MKSANQFLKHFSRRSHFVEKFQSAVHPVYFGLDKTIMYSHTKKMFLQFCYKYSLIQMPAFAQWLVNDC